MNIITISGCIGSSELKNIGGSDLLEFSLAVKLDYAKDKANDIQWFYCTIWGKRATSLAQYLVKGAGVVVGGEMLLNYDKDAKKGYPKVNVDKVDIIKWANDQPQQQKQPSQQSSQQTNYQDDFNGFQAIDGDSEEIPF
jgi:single-strand DNA-binding protein